MLDLPAGQNRPAYSKKKRLKRGWRKLRGHWHRQHYDVRLIHQNGQPKYKQVVFKTIDEACRISDNLQQYGATPHLPAWRGRRDNVVWVDFVDGTPCRHIDDAWLPQLAECFGAFANRRSSLVALDSTSYWRRHVDNLEYLRHHRVIDRATHRALAGRSRAVAPSRIRVGFDYIDPIGANLVRRKPCGRICAIDIKNLRADKLVGHGLAKASDRWLNADRRRYLFAHLETLGLSDIPRNFPFVVLFEAVLRVRQKTVRDIACHRRVRKPRAKQNKLAGLLD